MGLISKALGYSGAGSKWYDISINLTITPWPTLTYTQALANLYNNCFTSWQTISLANYTIELGWIFSRRIPIEIFQAIGEEIYASFQNPKATQVIYPKEEALSDVTFFHDSEQKFWIGTAIITKDIKNNKFIGFKLVNSVFVGGKSILQQNFTEDGKLHYNQYVYTPYTYNFSGNVKWQYNGLFFKPYSYFSDEKGIIAERGTQNVGVKFNATSEVPYTKFSTVSYDSDTKIFTETSNEEEGVKEVNLNTGVYSYHITNLISRKAFDSYQEYLIGAIDIYKDFTAYTAVNYDEYDEESGYNPELDQNIQFLDGLYDPVTSNPPYTGYFS